MQQKKLIQSYKNYIFLLILSFSSFGLTYHYGFIGIMPMDNTVLFNGGYRVLNNYIPFNDYWLVTGPILDYLNALFFKVFGISWKSFMFHSSLFNSLLAIASYFFFLKLNLNYFFAFFYALLISILFYPVVGTPFVDHHSTFFLILSFYALIISIKTDNYKYFIFIPTVLLLSFLSKQTPAAYGIITISLITIIMLFFNLDKFKEKILYILFGCLISLVVFILFFILTGIKFQNFFNQYIMFASSIGGNRLSSYEFNLINEIINYKFLSYFIFLLIFLLFKVKNNKKVIKKNFLIISSFLCLCLLMIFHQIISLNQNFIFFLIPLLCGLIHSFHKSLKSKYLLIFTLGICIFSVSKYHLRFNEERKFNELENIDISLAKDAKILDQKLSGLKWITYLNPNNPQTELDNLKKVIEILKRDKSKKILITNYQIISPIVDIYDNSPNQWHHPSVSFPLNGNKYFPMYKNYFLKNIIKNNIDFIYETREDDNLITSLILDEKCYERNRLSEMLVSLKLKKNCKDFQ